MMVEYEEALAAAEALAERLVRVRPSASASASASP